MPDINKFNSNPIEWKEQKEVLSHQDIIKFAEWLISEIDDYGLSNYEIDDWLKDAKEKSIFEISYYQEFIQYQDSNKNDILITGWIEPFPSGWEMVSLEMFKKNQTNKTTVYSIKLIQWKDTNKIEANLYYWPIIEDEFKDIEHRSTKQMPITNLNEIMEVLKNFEKRLNEYKEQRKKQLKEAEQFATNADLSRLKDDINV